MASSANAARKGKATVNLREGTRRLALLSGVAGATFGGFASYAELQSAMRQTANRQRFEKLASSPTVQGDRNRLLEDYVKQTLPKSDLSAGLESHLHKNGIDTIIWSNGYQIASIITEDGQTLYPTPAPSRWLYLFAAILPPLGFLLLWALIRAVGWVGTGFFQSSK